MNTLQSWLTTQPDNLAQLILPLGVIFLLLCNELFHVCFLLLLQVSPPSRLHCRRHLLLSLALLDMSLTQGVNFTTVTGKQSVKLAVDLLSVFVHFSTTFALQLNTTYTSMSVHTNVHKYVSTHQVHRYVSTSAMHQSLHAPNNSVVHKQRNSEAQNHIGGNTGCSRYAVWRK